MLTVINYAYNARWPGTYEERTRADVGKDKMTPLEIWARIILILL